MQHITSSNDHQPEDARFYYNRGVEYLHKDDGKRAAADFNKAIKLDPNFIAAYYDRGVAHRHIGKFDQAIIDFSEVIQRIPIFPDAYAERGRCYMLLGDLDNAIADFNRAIELDPDSAVAYEFRGCAYSDRGEHDLAITDYNKAIELNPDCALPYLDREYLSHSYTSNSEALDLLEPGVVKVEYVHPDDFFDVVPEQFKQADEMPIEHLQSVVASDDWIHHLEGAMEQGFAPDEEELRKFSHQCWREILYERRYQVPSRGRAEIRASAELRDLINLNCVGFVQEGIEPPGVFLRFQFGGNLALGIVGIDRDGSTKGFHKRGGRDMTDRIIELIIEAVAFSYYRDLVTPGKTYQYVPEGGSPNIRSVDRPRPLPRPRGIPVTTEEVEFRRRRRVSKEKAHDLEDWYYVQERAKHYVTGHMRWVREEYIASYEKQQQALEFSGRALPTGYTWVIEHERGGASESGLRLRGGQLVEKTTFLPPKRASQELSDLLTSYFGSAKQ
jgi:tetratricopeptide (TPR) repeat protein